MKKLQNKVNMFLEKYGIRYINDIESYYTKRTGAIESVNEDELVGILINELRKHKLTINNEYLAIEYRSIVKEGTMISNLYNDGSLLENLSKALDDIL